MLEQSILRNNRSMAGKGKQEHLRRSIRTTTKNRKTGRKRRQENLSKVSQRSVPTVSRKIPGSRISRTSKLWKVRPCANHPVEAANPDGQFVRAWILSNQRRHDDQEILKDILVLRIRSQGCHSMISIGLSTKTDSCVCFESFE
jgi:hypothetical protein